MPFRFKNATPCKVIFIRNELFQIRSTMIVTIPLKSKYLVIRNNKTIIIITIIIIIPFVFSFRKIYYE